MKNVPREQITKEREEGEEEQHQYRRASIKRKDVDILGLTPGCRGCISLNRKNPGGKSIEHNEECRKRHENKMRKMGDARIIQQDYRLLKSMEQEGEKLEKKTKANEVQVTSINQQGGVHQQGGGSSSGAIQGGESDIQMESTVQKQKPTSEDKRMGELNSDVNMRASGKRQRDERTEDDPEEQATKYATVEVQEEEGTIRNI